MPNQNNIQKPKAPQPIAPVKQYDAGDLWDAYSLGECDLKWFATAISDLDEKFREHKQNLIKSYGVYEGHFEQIEIFLGMYEYLIQNRLDYYRQEAQKYEEEHYTNKKEVTL